MTTHPFRFILFLLICVSIPLTATAQVVDIPDPNLETAIAITLDKSWGDPITTADMARLTHLNVREANISDLTGLEHATNLTKLELVNNHVSDLSPLAGLTNLTYLQLLGNSASNLSPLVGLTNLETLLLRENGISDLSPLSGLTNLTRLGLASNNISNLSSLSGLTNLETLGLRNNNISNISPLAQLTRLAKVVLNHNNISDLSPLADLTNLTRLELEDNNISDISTLAGLTNLTQLRLVRNNISDISALAGLTNLTWLGIWYNNITDISPVAGLTNLTWLSFGANIITDISPVAGLTNLTELWLDANTITDISAVASLTNLKGLWLYNNNISDLSPVVANTGLGSGDIVNVHINPLSYPSLHTHIPALQSRGVTVEFDNRTLQTLLKISGTVTPSDNLLIVEVRDSEGVPFEGVAVTFTVTSGGGTLSATTVTSNTNGRAQTTLTLGSTGEPNNVEASVAGVVQTVTFSDVPEPTVHIPDPHLHAAIAQAVGKGAGVPITVGDMETLTRLEARNANISDLTGLEFATNLTWLNLSYEEVEWRRVNSNAVSDLSPLAGLTKLRELWLHYNNISDLTPLSGLTSLKQLEAGANSITDISAVAGLTNLERLGLWDNAITDISAIAGLTNLRGVWLWDNAITDISVVAGMANLRWMSFGGNNVSDISAVAGLTNLTELHLPNNNISDFSVVADLKNLERLNLGSNNITNLSFLSGLTNLRNLSLGHNRITDISPLIGLTKLRDLHLDGNRITDIAPLSGLPQLRYVNLNWNRITDISPLVGKTELTRVNLWGNFLSYPSLRTHIPTLQGRGVNVEFEDRTPSTLRKISGDQHGSPAAPLPKPFVVEVRDRRNRTFAGVPVTFAITAGGGALSITSTETDPNGRTESTLTLGSGTGANTVSVSAAGIQQTVTFNAVAREGIIIPDSKLRTAIGIALNKSFGETITPSDMAALTSLEAEEAGISDLTGLELATNLTELRLGRNNISDISAVAGLTNLTQLDLGRNNISDISAVAGLTNLTQLDLGRNNISDISAVARLTDLTGLGLWGNTISDISPVVRLTKLTRLDLGGNNISNISAVARLTNLTDLSLWGNTISDISVVKGLTKLRSLDLWDNTISDISVVKGLTHLTRLNFNNNSVSDISVVKGLTNLTRLHLHSNSVSDISAVAGLTHLTRLALSNNSVSDISAVAGLTNLTELSFGDNSVSDISVLASLIHLRELEFWNNSVSDISVLASLTQLAVLSLGGNSISDISPLVDNTELGSEDWILLWGNPLSYPALRTHIPTLQGRGVNVEFEDRTPTTLRTISGYNQKGVSGETLANPFVVEVQDEWGRAFAGVPVTFRVTAGGGTLSVTSTETDENGRAQATLTVGSDVGLNTISVSAVEIQQPVSFNAVSESIQFDLSMPVGISLIHVPLKVTTVDGVAKTIASIADLYDALGGAENVSFLITYDSQNQEWFSYFGTSDTDTPADRALTDDMGIVASMTTRVSVQLTGNPLGTDGNSIINLASGLNLIGIPLRDERINRVSDLLTLDGIKDNVPVIILSDNGEFKTVGRAGDPGDVEITGGQAFILNAQQAATVAISGEGWTNGSGITAAPLVGNALLQTDTTPVVALRGAIVDEATRFKVESFRVTVKNLSTDRVVTGVTRDEGVGYQLTVVEVETGRAARIGDILEITARSPHPLIGVEPLQYTITAEDVKRSLIQLPELVAYEIPAETELLRNYPNPFNPETWIPYRLAEDAFVTLTIYDLTGQVVRTLEVGHQVAAVYESRSKAIYWDGRNEVGESVASGVYFYHLLAGDYSATRKMVILK